MEFNYTIHFYGESICCQAPVLIDKHTCTKCDKECEVIIKEETR